MELQRLPPASRSGLPAGSSARDRSGRLAQAERPLLLHRKAWRDRQPWHHEADRRRGNGGLPDDPVDRDSIGYLRVAPYQTFEPSLTAIKRIPKLTARGLGSVSCRCRGL